MANPPSAPRRPHVISAHGDDRVDPWFWLREREDPEVLAYLEAENTYTEEEAAPLAELRNGLFEEMKARIKETDMSVPTRRGPWWYYSRTEEGKDYGIYCRRPARDLQELPPAGEPGEEEQILLDENLLAEGTDYFAVGSAAVSHDHHWLAFSTDHLGNEKYELQFRPLDAGIAGAAESVPETGYGLAWSAEADYVFYVRMDEAQRPFQLWRHRLGSDPTGDVLVFEELDRRFSLGTGSTRDTAFVLIGLHSTNTTEWLAIPSSEPLAEPRVVLPRREGVEYAVDHLTPAGGGTGWFIVLTNEEAQDFRVLAAPDDALGTATAADAWREVVPHRPGTRIEDVDAFGRALVLSERAEAQPRVRVLPLPDRDEDPFAADLLQSGWVVPSIESPSSTWLGANPEPDAPALRIGRMSLVTPSSVLQITLDERQETLLKQEPVLGDFDPARYTTYREWAVADDGTRVPLSVVHRKDLDLPAPCILYGYGAYEVSIDPSFSPHRLSLLDRGIVFAIAHVRGGGEMGRAWYEDGRMEHKANTFSDFIACARHLLDVGIARPGHAGRPGRLGRWPAHRGRGQRGARALPGARGRGALRRLRDNHARRRAAPDRRRMGGVGEPPGGRVGLSPHADLFALRQRDGPEHRRLAAHLPGPFRHGRPQRSASGLLGAGQMGGQAAGGVAVDQGAPQDRTGRRPRRSLRSLRRVEGRGAGLRVPRRRPRAGRQGLTVGRQIRC